MKSEYSYIIGQLYNENSRPVQLMDSKLTLYRAALCAAICTAILMLSINTIYSCFQFIHKFIQDISPALQNFQFFARAWMILLIF